MKRKHYYYDEKYECLINSEGLMQIIQKNDLVWRELGAEYESYARAICLGQGCWELIESITEEQAQEILKNWGYDFSKDNM